MTNYGFIEPKIESDHWVLGDQMPKEVLAPDGDWTKFVPPGEQQNISTETYNCTAFGTTNAVETYLFRKYGDTINLSDRALGILAGTKKPGNDPHIVCEALRHFGDCTEDVLPFQGQTTEEYFTPSPLPQSVLDECKKFTDKYDFNHEWVVLKDMQEDMKKQLIKEYLQYSPLGVALYAWQGYNGLYYRTSPQDTHFCEMVGYKDGEYWIVYDSYPEDGVFFKKLHWDFGFNYIKRIYITKKPVVENQTNALFVKLSELLKILSSLLKK